MERISLGKFMFYIIKVWYLYSHSHPTVDAAISLASVRTLLLIIVPGTTPALSIPFALNLNEDVHVPFVEILQGTLLDVRQVRVACRDDVDDAKDASRFAVVMSVVMGMVV